MDSGWIWGLLTGLGCSEREMLLFLDTPWFILPNV